MRACRGSPPPQSTVVRQCALFAFFWGSRIWNARVNQVHVIRGHIGARRCKSHDGRVAVCSPACTLSANFSRSNVSPAWARRSAQRSEIEPPSLPTSCVWTRDSAHPQIQISGAPDVDLRFYRSSPAPPSSTRPTVPCVPIGESAACSATSRRGYAPRAAPCWRPPCRPPPRRIWRSRAPSLSDRPHADGRSPSELNTFSRPRRARRAHAVAQYRQMLIPKANFPVLEFCPSRSSPHRGARTASSARTGCASGMAKQMECAALPRDIKITISPESRSAPDKRCAVTPRKPRSCRRLSRFTTSATGRWS